MTNLQSASALARPGKEFELYSQVYGKPNRVFELYSEAYWSPTASIDGSQLDAQESPRL